MRDQVFLPRTRVSKILLINPSSNHLYYYEKEDSGTYLLHENGLFIIALALPLMLALSNTGTTIRGAHLLRSRQTPPTGLILPGTIHTTIHMYHLPRHITSLIRSKIHHRIRHILRRAQPSQRNPLLEAL